MAKRFEKAREYTQKYKPILLPCKECGCEDIKILSDRTIFNPKNVWSVSCSNCGECVYGFARVNDAVQRWNEKMSKEQ